MTYQKLGLFPLGVLLSEASMVQVVQLLVLVVPALHLLQVLQQRMSRYQRMCLSHALAVDLLVFQEFPQLLVPSGEFGLLELGEGSAVQVG